MRWPAGFFHCSPSILRLHAVEMPTRHCRQGPIDDDLDLHAAFSLADPPAGRRPIPARSCAAADEDVNQAFGISLAAYYSFQ
jgi:hypothetical protein